MQMGKNPQGRERYLGFLEDSLAIPTGYRLTPLPPCFSVIALVSFQPEHSRKGHLMKIT